MWFRLDVNMKTLQVEKINIADNVNEIQADMLKKYVKKEHFWMHKLRRSCRQHYRKQF